MKENNRHKDSRQKIDLDKNIEICLNTSVDKYKRICALLLIKRFCLSYQTFQRHQPWEPSDPLMEKVVNTILMLLEDKEIEIVSETVRNIPVSNMRILKKLVDVLRNNKTKYGAYQYWNVKYTLRELILKQIKWDFQSIIKRQWYGAETFRGITPIIENDKKEFILNLLKTKGVICNEKIRRILDFLDPNDTPINKNQVEWIKKEKKIMKDLAYKESGVEEGLEEIINVVDDYMIKKIENPEFKRHIDEVEANEKRRREEYYLRSSQCKICGKIFSGKEPTRIIHDKTTGMEFVQPYDSQRISRLWATWECLCNHIAERLFGSILIQERMVNNKIADIIINDGSVKVNNDKKVTDANKIIEVKLGMDFQEGLRGAILKYIDYCNSMEFWLCYDSGEEDVQGLLDKQLIEFGEKLKSEKERNKVASGFYENEIEWIKKTKDIVGNKKIILRGWMSLLKELKNKETMDLIEAMREIVKEYGYPFVDRRFLQKTSSPGAFLYIKNSPEIQKEIEKRFNEVLKT